MYKISIIGKSTYIKRTTRGRKNGESLLNGYSVFERG